jgi:uncharacterized protein YyaL (SSP411 family)
MSHSTSSATTATGSSHRGRSSARALAGLLALAAALPAQESRPDTRPLAREKSPYLRQHLDNPVRWYPWGEEAFAKARSEDKPVFLSIGYASCHWCHVMEKESFDHEGVAAILNESFVPVKVDREERPDVDQIYMQATVTMIGRGGWPLSVFLTPEKKPFYAGTYFPLEDVPNQTGFRTVIVSIRDAWKARREALVGAAERLERAMRTAQLPAAALESRARGLESRAAAEAESRPDGGPVAAELAWIKSLLARKQGPAPKDLLAAASLQLLDLEDKTYGGFGSSMKFPVPVDALALLRFHARTGNAAALEAVRRQFDAMWHGGIHDHVGGGFHRYSTDRNWRVPHFEKMLYDQAFIARVYLELAQAVPSQPVYEGLCRETLDFCLGTLRAEGGGFIAALDATVNGVEGGTYRWNLEQIHQVLEAGSARTAFEQWAGLAEGTIHEATDVERIAKATGQSASELRKAITDALARLLKARNERPQPARVEHVITAWNAWLISTLARAGLVLNDAKYKDAAIETMAFLDAKLRQPDGLYARRYMEGEARFAGTLSDQAAVLEALLDLHEMTLDPRWLARAVEMAPKVIERFGRPDGSFDDSVERDLIFRPHDLSDGSVPSGVSQMNVALARIARLTGRPADLERARKAIQAVLPALAAGPADHAYGAIAWDLAFQPVKRVVFQGPPPIVTMLRAPITLAYRPDVVMTIAPLTEKPVERASAVVWVSDTPSEPVFDSASLLKLLDAPQKAESR